MKLPKEVVSLALREAGLGTGNTGLVTGGQLHPQVVARSRQLRRSWKRYLRSSPKLEQNCRVKLGSKLYLADKNAADVARELESLTSSLPEPDFDDLAIIELLGQGLVRRADSCLPNHYKRLAMTWKRTSSSKRQFEIAEELCFALSSKGVPSVEDSMCEQRIDSIFAHRFGRFPWGKSHGPNCLGRTLIVAAFFHRAEEKRIFAGQRIELTQQELHRRQNEVAEACLKSCTFDVHTRERFHTYCNAVMKKWRGAQQEVSYPHLFVVVKAKNGNWFSVDGLGGRTQGLSAPGYFSLDQADEAFSQLGPFWKGHTILQDSNRIGRYLPSEHIAKNITIIGQNLACLKRKGFAWNFERTSKYLSFTAGFYAAILDVMPDDVKTRHWGLLKKFGLTREDITSENYKSEKTRQGITSMLMTLAASDCDRVAVLDAISDPKFWNRERLDKALSNLPLELVSVFSNLCFFIAHDIARLRLISNLEIGNVHHQIGIAALTHISNLMGLGDSTVRALMNCGWTQFILHNASTLLVREPENWRKDNPLAHTAFCELSQSPRKLMSFNFISQLIGEQS